MNIKKNISLQLFFVWTSPMERFAQTKSPSETKEHIEATRLHNAILPSKE